MAACLGLAWRAHIRYQRWLDSDLSNREEFRLTWLRAFIIAFGATLVLWSGTVLFESFVKELNYFDRFPLYLWFSLRIYGLGVGGLRSATLAYPRPEPTAPSELEASVMPGPDVDAPVPSPGAGPTAELGRHGSAMERTGR